MATTTFQTENQGLYPIFTAQYSSNLELLLQQLTTLLRPHVTESGGYVGKMASPVTQFGSVVMRGPVGRFAALQHQQPDTIRPWIFPQPGELPQLIDSFDRLETIVDPQSGYVKAAAAATGRFWDDGIIQAFFGARQIGTDIGSLTSDTFSTTNFQVSNTFGSSVSSGLTVAKLIEAQRILRHYHNDLEMDAPCLVIGSQQASDLLNQVQFVSTEFNERPMLVEGRVKRFMGMDIVISERLSVSASLRSCCVFVKTGMHLGIWQDVTNYIDIRHDLSGRPFQLLTQTMFGAVRMQAGKVIQIQCQDASGQDITP
jgi:hypothetical protein